MNSRSSMSIALTSSILVTMSIIFRPVLATAPYAVTTWTASSATFYGGEDASGTMGGACGYGNLIVTGYGLQTTALSPVLFNGANSCGACFQIQCIKSQSKWCYANGGSITVTATNLCPANWNRITDGWCNPPRTHFDLSYPMFAKLAQRVAGIIPVEYRRVPCVKPGGIKYRIEGNPWFNLVLVYNVAREGAVVNMQMKGSTTPYYVMRRNWGCKWELHRNLYRQRVSFRVTASSGQILTSANVCPESWTFGQSFQCIYNF